MNVENAAPTAIFTATGGAGTATATLSNATDPSAADVAAGFKYSFDFNGDYDFSDPGEIANGTSPTATVTLAAGTYKVIGKIADKDGGANYYTSTITVTDPPPANQPPAPSFAFPANLIEGDSRTLTGAAALLSGRTATKWEWDFDYDGSTFTADATGQSATFAVGSADGPSTRKIALRVTDSAGQVGLYSASGTIANAAPKATLVAGPAVTLGTASTVSLANASDPSAADVAAGFKYSFDFNNDGDFLDAGDVANSNSPTASFAFTTAGSRVVRARVADKDGGYTDYTTTVTVNAPPSNAQLRYTGSVIGTPGSLNNNGNTAAKAFDGDLSTYVELPVASAGWVGLDLGVAKVIGEVRFACRAGYGDKMVGGRFQASNYADFSKGISDITRIVYKPLEGQLNALLCTNTTAFRYVRYIGPNNSYDTIAEVQVFGPRVNNLTKATGTLIGTAGSLNNNGNTGAKAFDGNLSSYVELPVASAGWTGIDLGTAKPIGEIRFANRSGYGDAMVGGRFQASNVADFSKNIVDLTRIVYKPLDGQLNALLVTNTNAYRYVRYIGPNNSYGTIAEIQVFV